MDICDNNQKKGTVKCEHHKEYSSAYILLNDINEGDVLICNQCIENDKKYDNLVAKDYQSIEPLIMADDKTILPKWPPLNNQGILREIKEHLHVDNTIIKKQKDTVIAYFDLLLCDVVKHIEDIKKQMLQKCTILPDLEEQLYSEYNKIAEKEKLKEALFKSNSSFEEANSKLREIIKQKKEQKQTNEESLQKIFDSYLYSLNQFDENTPTLSMNQIFKLIKSINFFPESPITKDKSLMRENSFVTQIVKALENRTNFWTQEFIDEAKSKLQEWSFIFQQFEVNQIYKEGYEEPLNFKALSEQQLSKLELLVENIKDQQKNTEQTPKVKLITDLINSQANRLTKESEEQIQLKLQQLTDGFEDKSKNKDKKTHININKISEEQVELIQQLVNKMSELSYEINSNCIDTQQLPNSSQILQKLGSEQTLLSHQLSLLFQQYPICELNNKPQFIKGYYNNSQTNIDIQNMEDSQVKFTKINNNGWANIMTNQYLERNITYQVVFEINYTNQQSFTFVIGISSNEKDNIASNDSLSFYTNHCGISTGCGMDKVKKGSRDNLKFQKQLQLSVNLSKGIFEIGDYPNLNNIMEVDDDKKAKLQLETLYQIIFTINDQNDHLLIKSISKINE